MAASDRGPSIPALQQERQHQSQGCRKNVSVQIQPAPSSQDIAQGYGGGQPADDTDHQPFGQLAAREDDDRQNCPRDHEAGDDSQSAHPACRHSQFHAT